MDWLKKNWLWLLLSIPAVFIGLEIVSFIYANASKESSVHWFNKLKFWNAGTGGAHGPAANGENLCGRREAAACVPASARVCCGGSGGGIKISAPVE